jgi:hypothetical protein
VHVLAEEMIDAVNRVSERVLIFNNVAF